MKRLSLILAFLFVYTNAYAGIITYDTSATLTRDYLNDTLSTAYNEINGALDTDNLAAGAVTSNDIATAVSPLIRDFENVGEYVYTSGGLLPPTSANLSATTTAGTAYIANDGDSTLHRVVKAATAKTYTASKDTWVYLDYGGTYAYNEQTLGAAQPTTPDNSILLAKVVTDADNVTSVVDYRQTAPPNVRVALDLKNGCSLSRDVSDVDVVNIFRGEIEFGSANGKLRRNTVTADVNFATTGRGGLDTGSLAAGYYYIFAVADDDNDDNFEGIASLSNTDASGVTGERLIGWCYAPTTSAISPDSLGAYKGVGGDAPNIVKRIGVTDVSTTSTSHVNMPDMDARFYSSGRPIEITFSAPLEHSNGGLIVYGLSIDTVGVSESALYGGGAAKPFQVNLHWVGILNEGEHTAQIMWHTIANTAQQDATTDGLRVLVIEEK